MLTFVFINHKIFFGEAAAPWDNCRPLRHPGTTDFVPPPVMPLLLIGVDGMFVTQCFAEIDRHFKGDFSEPESDRSKLFLQRMSILVCLTFLRAVKSAVHRQCVCYC